MTLWIQVEQSLGRHRKTLQACTLLKIDRSRFVGHLVALWCWGIDNADMTTGLLRGCTPQQIAVGAEWPVKDAARFIDALLRCGGDGRPGFLETGVEGLVLHDWGEHTGGALASLENRKERNRRAQAAARDRQRLRSDDVSDASQLRQRPTGPDRTGPKRSEPDNPPSSPPGRQRLRAADDDGADAPSEPSCCPNFAATQTEHWQFCPNAAREAVGAVHGED